MEENAKDNNQVNGETEVKEEKKSGGVKIGLRIKFSVGIIALVFIIIMTISGYFIYRESNLLKEQIFSSVNREVIHLSNTAQESIGVDELALISAVNNLKKISYIKYAFVLDMDNTLIQYFDQRGEREIGEKLEDNIIRKSDQAESDEKIKIIDYPDPGDSSGMMFDFSKPVLNKLDKKKIGVVIIGLSDIIIREQRASMIRVIILISLLFLAIAVIGSIILASITIRPIKKLSQGAAIIGQGDLDYRIDIKSSDELGQLAREFNIMTSMIKDAKEKEIESRIMDEQNESAREIQEGMNPMYFYEKDGVQIKGFTKAKDFVGGDYFDFMDFDENRVGALICDVSGKGVPASLVMVMIKTVFTSYISRKDIDCASVVSAINDSLSSVVAVDRFATLLFMIYDRRTEELSFTNAGHSPVYIYRSSSNKCTETFLDGLPIGVDGDFEYMQGKVKLGPGDMVVLHSDGVHEMRNKDKEEYGQDRVYRLMLSNYQMNAKDFVQLLVDEVDEFKGEEKPVDDETILVLKREL